MTTKAYTRMIGDAPSAAQVNANTAAIAANATSTTAAIASNTVAIQTNAAAIAANTARDAQGAVLIVPSNYTPVGDEPDTVVTDANLPNTVSVDNRYVLTNPFGENCEVVAEIYYNNLWSISGWMYPNGPGAYGAKASMASNSSSPSVIVQTGSYKLLGYSRDTGGGQGYAGSYPTSAPCRVWCYPVKLTGGAG